VWQIVYHTLEPRKQTVSLSGEQLCNGFCSTVAMNKLFHRSRTFLEFLVACSSREPFSGASIGHWLSEKRDHSFYKGCLEF
jgi:hypothetical protein